MLHQECFLVRSLSRGDAGLAKVTICQARSIDAEPHGETENTRVTFPGHADWVFLKFLSSLIHSMDTPYGYHAIDSNVSPTRYRIACIGGPTGFGRFEMCHFLQRFRKRSFSTYPLLLSLFPISPQLLATILSQYQYRAPKPLL